MGRAIVLLLCLVSAGGIAAYTQYVSREPSEHVPVFTVPQRTEAPRVPVAPAQQPSDAAPADKVGLARQIQRELRRVGCYSGEASGAWTTSTRMAMKEVVDRVNSTLPIDSPDPVLLSLVQGQPDNFCTPRTKADEASSTAPLALGAAATAAAALAAKDGEPKLPMSSDRTRQGPPIPDNAAPGDSPQSSIRKDAATPSATDRRHRRSWKERARPPRIVRDFLRAFGVK